MKDHEKLEYIHNTLGQMTASVTPPMSQIDDALRYAGELKTTLIFYELMEDLIQKKPQLTESVNRKNFTQRNEEIQETVKEKPEESKAKQPLSVIQRLTLLYLKGGYRAGVTALKDVPALVGKMEPVKKTSINSMSPVYRQYDGVLFDWKKGWAGTGGELLWYPSVSSMTEAFVMNRCFHHQVLALSNYIRKGYKTPEDSEMLDKQRQSLLTGCPDGHLSDFIDY